MESEDYYAQIANQYIQEDPFWQEYHRRRFNTFNSLVPEEPLRILDFGCGSAENVVILEKRGHTVLGIDPVREMIDLGKVNMTGAGLDPGHIAVWWLRSHENVRDGQFRRGGRAQCPALSH